MSHSSSAVELALLGLTLVNRPILELDGTEALKSGLVLIPLPLAEVLSSLANILPLSVPVEALSSSVGAQLVLDILLTE